MAQRDSGYERIDGDRYFTPVWVAERVRQTIFARYGAPLSVVDLSAGAGHLLVPFQAKGIEVKGYDIQPDNSLGMAIEKRDTLLNPIKSSRFIGRADADLIIMNPPYGERGSLAIRFILAALDAVSRVGTVAVLLPVDFDSGKTRRHLFSDNKAFAGKLVLTQRIRWANVVQGKSGPSSNHAWFIWDKAMAAGDARFYEYD